LTLRHRDVALGGNDIAFSHDEITFSLKDCTL
jgi:hypothetical protein